jgi:hypothetical protein
MVNRRQFLGALAAPAFAGAFASSAFASRAQAFGLHDFPADPMASISTSMHYLKRIFS